MDARLLLVWTATLILARTGVPGNFAPMYFARFLVPVFLVLLSLRVAVAEDEGIFADFETSMGNFTCRLEYEHAPWAVANFIGLAEGTRAWVDPATGAVRGGPYYDGITFHRVIDGFMNQSGSRNGLGTDGPGYTFRDEVDNGLTHDRPGILSMANSGPQTNGAQFFVTVAETSWLDGKHTVFGAVVEGMDVVMEINGVPKLPDSSVPVTPVILERVVIRRVGEAAEAFDIHAQELPICRPLPGVLEVVRGVRSTFHTANPIEGSFMLQGWQSADLQAWQRLGQIYFAPGAEAYSSVDLDNGSAVRRFFNLSLTEYPVVYAPLDNRGRTLTVEWTSLLDDDAEKTAIYEYGADGGNGDFEYTENGSTVTGTFNQFGYVVDGPWVSFWGLQPMANIDIFRMQGTFTGRTETHYTGVMRVEVYEGVNFFGQEIWTFDGEGEFSLTR